MLSQGSQGAAGRAERSAARVGEGSASDRVVLEGAGLAARAEVRVCRRFHGRHAGVIGVQVGVIHLIHGDQPVRTPVCSRKAEGETLGREGSGVSSVEYLFKPVRGGLSLQDLQELLVRLSKTPLSFVVVWFRIYRCFVFFSFFLVAK